MKNIYDVYQRVVGGLTQYIETTVLQAVSYCFYEILDNVLSFLVADDGIGVRESLSENEQYSEISESEALTLQGGDEEISESELI